MARKLLRADDAPTEGARRLREMLRTKTLAQLARKTACDLSAVRRWAVGERTPSGAFRERLHDALGIPEQAWEIPPLTKNGAI